ncbi:LolA family protein [Marinicella rhabdoformis]|uniref:LolA family protein n=1 Tax=Marinicella rhabdoformis TaxID=2580566 RepID=UPI0012AED657|nr:hypothetical protein [Marinicella rhabdoformis]
MKISITKVAGTLGMLAWGVSVQASDLTLEGVLNDYYEAKGGLEVIRGIKTMHAKGKMSMGGMEVPLEISAKRPGKVHVAFEVQGMKGIQAFDGEKGWSVMPFMGKPDPEEMADDQLKQIQEQADMDGVLVDYEKKGHNVELIGTSEIEGTPVIELKVTKKGGDVMTYFLDEEYKLEVMVRAQTTMMGQEMITESYTSGYEEIGDTVVPMQTTVKMNGTVGQNLVFESVEFNTDIDDALFSMPAKAEKPEAATADK